MVGSSISEASGEGNGPSRVLPQKSQLSPTSSGNGTKKLSTTLLDLDSLHCPICFEVLTIPIFQCYNGHLACSSCCPKLSNKCPACALSIGHIRCRAMETVLQSVFIPCRNVKLGCTKNASYGNELTHEKECEFSPCSCPVQDCDYTALYRGLYIHHICTHEQISNPDPFSCGVSCSAKMKISDKILIQRDFMKLLLFAVQCFKEPCGVYVTVSCIAPSAPEVGEFSYHLSYTVDGHKLTYESPKMKMVLQCDNGHLACSSCCPKLSNKCPACALPIGHIRCRAMETVLESVFVPCRNAKFGCTKNASYGNELAHEKECKFSLCSCPVQDCNYTALYEDLFFHYIGTHWQCKHSLFRCDLSFSAKMSISEKILILRECGKGLLFAVQCFREPYGVYVTVSCIAPSAPEVGEFSYHLSHIVDGHTMIYESPKMKMVLEVSSQTPQEDFMLIPDNFLRGDVLLMKICTGS